MRFEHWFYTLPLRLRSLFRRRKVEEELSEELEYHIEQKTEQYIAQGMDAEQARRTALRDMDGLERHKEECRDMRHVNFIEDLLKDLRFGLRQLRRNPGFTAVAIITLALGIGANTAIFSVVNAALLEPLLFPHSERLVRLWNDYGHKGNHAPVSYPDFADWRAWNHSFLGMAALTGTAYTLTGNGEPEHLQGITASASLFQVFAVQPVLGRRFRTEEDLPHADDGADAIILSYKLWQTRFAADPNILGRIIKLDDKPFIVVGVAPQGIESRMGSPHAQFWTTIAPLTERSPNSPKPVSEERSISFLMTVARLKRGVTQAQAQADMDHVAAELMHAYPKDDPDEGVLIKSLQQSMTSDARPVLLLLLCAVGVVLLIACADVGGMLLARAAGRQREIAIRAALGAGRRRIARQLLVESLLLAFIAGGFGLWIGLAAKGWLDRYLGLTGIAPARMDGWVLGFTFLIAILAVIIFGLAPALHAAKTDPAHDLKEGGLTASGSWEQRRLRSALVTSQIALAAVLLTSAGLLTRSLIRLERTNPGFNPQHVLTFPVTLAEQRYPQATWALFFQELDARLRALPGVISASAGFELPFQGGESRTVLENVAGRKIPTSRRRGIAFSPVTPGYFRTLGIPILKGREFRDSDTATSMPVVIINETAARRYFGNHNPIGQQIEPEMWDGSGSKTETRTIVGVAGNVKLQSLREATSPMIYWPIAQIPCDSSMHVEIRTTVDPLSLASAARVQLHAMDKELPFYGVWPLDHYVSESLSQTRYNVWLVALFAILSLILTATGLYGSIAYSTAQRTHEIGIRMALGATPQGVRRMVVRQGMKLALIGVAIGIAAAFGLTRLIASMLYGVKASDPLIYISVAVLLSLIALLACYIPARRASRVDPTVALRYK